MIDSYLEQCKQAGRELAIKEASASPRDIQWLLGYQPRSLFGGSALMDTLGLLGGSAALAAGAKAISRSKGLRNINRTAGAAGGALGGVGLGLNAYAKRHGSPSEGFYIQGIKDVGPLGVLRGFKTYYPTTTSGGGALSGNMHSINSLLQAAVGSLGKDPVRHLTEGLPYIYAPTLLGAYAGTKLVKGSEKLQPILAKRLRS